MDNKYQLSRGLYPLTPAEWETVKNNRAFTAAINDASRIEKESKANEAGLEEGSYPDTLSGLPPTTTWTGPVEATGPNYLPETFGKPGAPGVVYNNRRFDDLCCRFQQTQSDIMFRKGHEYSGSEDRLANFRRNAKALGLSKEQILLVYAEKHWGSIQSYVASGNKTHSEEKIMGRVLDLSNYLLLFAAMLDEAGEQM